MAEREWGIQQIFEGIVNVIWTDRPADAPLKCASRQEPVTTHFNGARRCRLRAMSLYDFIAGRPQIESDDRARVDDILARAKGLLAEDDYWEDADLRALVQDLVAEIERLQQRGH